MDIHTIVADVEQWTIAEVHELKAWLDAHVLHRIATVEAPAETTAVQPEAEVAPPAPPAA